MTSEHWDLVTRIFDAALDLPQSARDTLVRRECNGDAALEAEVLKLLAADEQAGSFLQRPAVSTLPRLGVIPLNQSLPAIPAGAIVSGRFEILRLIGQGGMGQVYEALDRELNERVALKAIRPDISADPRMLSRFRREVQLTRRITHPNVCRTFDLDRHSSTAADGSSSDLTFLTMELLEGETLADLLRRHGPLTTAEAHPLVLQMIDALSAAHAADIVHRDFKPSNVLLVPATTDRASDHAPPSNGAALARLRVVVTDFGLARALLPEGQLSAEHAASSLTGNLTGNPALMGTLAYMAPEQFERGEATVASDIYSLGLVMYEMLTGARPFADPIPFAEAAKRLKQPAPSPKTLVPEIDSAWDAAIRRCLELEPGNRFETAQELAYSLPASDSHGASRVSNFAQRLVNQAHRNQTRQNRRVAVIACVVLLIVSLSGLALRYYIRRQAPIPFAERDWILVTDFNNQTGEKVFDRVVRDLTVQSLSQSNYVNVVPRLTALEAAKRVGLKEVSSIDEKLGQEICLRESYKAIITGEILKEASGYAILLTAGVPGKKAKISEKEWIQSTDEIYSAVDRIATRLRQALGEPLYLIEHNTQTLAQVTTPSIGALQRYSASVDLYSDREYQRAINLAKDAVEQDPNFAMAHLLLGRSYENIGDDALAATEFEKARADSSHASERERHIILAAKYAADLQNEKAAQEYQHLLDIYPDDVDGLRHFAMASYYAGHPEPAISAQRRALALSPNDPESYDYLMEILVRTNHFSEALSVFEQARSNKVETTGFCFLAALSALGEDDLQKAQQLLETPAAAGSGYKDAIKELYLGKLFAYQGRMVDAAAAFRDGLSIARRPGSEDWASVFYYQLAKVAMAQGHISSAKLDARKATELVQTFSNVGSFEQLGSLAVDLREMESAQHFADLISKRAAEHKDPLSLMELHVLQGEIALAQGHVSPAVSEERKALGFLNGYQPLLTLGQACEQDRDWDCSIKAYSKYLENKGVVLRDSASSDWVIANYRLARVYAYAGSRPQAITYCQRFLDLYSSADPQLPDVVRANRDIKRWKALSN